MKLWNSNRYDDQGTMDESKYNEAFKDLTRLLEIEPDNTIALRYRGAINYMMKGCNESIDDLEKY
ncbi:hypothetical protein C2G38_2196436 [Gigaspora rosea]|uniref:Tetratricopeptide repeat protein n=1 Tax=Gigaspora rosea TaxID=44941 RepID=A0A397UWF1_9GLOM|nr:hypothetical protein C2G38_2196436 [Gigaspora rosea]